MGRKAEEFYKELIGKTVDEARQIAEKEGFTIRVTVEDLTPMIVTMDYRLDRINVTTRKGKVVATDMSIG